MYLHYPNGICDPDLSPAPAVSTVGLASGLGLLIAAGAIGVRRRVRRTQ